MTDEKYMRRCFELAKKGGVRAAPNPMVGAVIVHRDRIIGEGYHIQYGGPHAEVNAINSVAKVDQALLKESRMYVSLEPCNHFGRTPPCSQLLVQQQIPTVIAACEDPFPKVAGSGFETLRKAGCELKVGLLAEEALYLNRRFITYHQKKRPYIILKWAQTKDGFMGKENGQHWISNSLAQRLVHRWRSEEQAILVGTNTAQTDNPRLNVRLWEGPSPIRLVIDRTLRLSNDLHLFDNSIPTIVFTHQAKKSNKSNVRYMDIPTDQALIPTILDRLHQLNILSLIVEGGRQILQSFIDANLWDEARILEGNVYFKEGIKAPSIAGIEIAHHAVGDNRLSILQASNYS